MNWIPPTLEQLKEGLEVQIIDIIKSGDILRDVEEVKKTFKRDIIPELIYKSHVLTSKDIEYYTENQQLISRDIRILDSSPE